MICARPWNGGFTITGQHCWLRQLTPYANREQEDRALKVVARMDGTPFPSTARLTGRWFRGPDCREWPTSPAESRSCTRKVRESAQRKKAEKLQVGLETAYCAETVAITYEEMGLLSTEKHYNWFDPGSTYGAATRCH